MSFHLAIIVAFSCVLAPQISNAFQDTATEKQYADRIVLKTGAELRGEIVHESKQEGRPFIVFEIESGGVVKLDRARLVHKIYRADELTTEYERLKSAATDPKSHWAIVEWCKEQKNGKLRFAAEIEFHLRSIVKADPNDDNAWRKLGFVKREGVWIQDDAYLLNAGYVKVGTSWRPKQAAETTEQLLQSEKVRRESRISFKKWEKALKKMSSAQAKQALFAIMNPQVITHLYEFSREHSNAAVRRLAVDAIGTVNAQIAADALVKFAIQDPEVGVREAATTELRNRDYFTNNQVAGLVISGGFLRHQENKFVRRASVLLGQVPTDASILPLINSLETVHSVATGNQPGRLNTSAVGGNIQGLDTGGGPTHVDRKVFNQTVASALRRITGKEFVEGTGQSSQAIIAAAKLWYIDTHSFTDMEVREDDE